MVFIKGFGFGGGWFLKKFSVCAEILKIFSSYTCFFWHDEIVSKISMFTVFFNRKAYKNEY